MDVGRPPFKARSQMAMSGNIEEEEAGHPGCWWRLLQVVGDATVLHIDLRPNPDCESRALRLLDAEERDRSTKYRYAQHRRQFVLSRAAVRSILCERLGYENRDLTFRTLEHGKPVALFKGEPAPVSFNVTHSGAHGLIALCDCGRLGVDIEERSDQRDLDGMIDTVFTEPERAELASAHNADRLHLFYKLWTIKEAFIKALGTGLSLSPSLFEVPRAMRHGEVGSSLFEFPGTANVQWQLHDLGNEHFAAAVAHELRPTQYPAQYLESSAV